MKIILLVEDDSSLRKALQTKLEQAGSCEIITARDGAVGLETALKEHPDLIMLDLIMPHLDGVGMLEKLRDDKWGKTAKVLVLTNTAEDERVARCIELGAVDYLKKTDWKIDGLITEVLRVIEN